MVSYKKRRYFRLLRKFFLIYKGFKRDFKIIENCVIKIKNVENIRSIIIKIGNDKRRYVFRIIVDIL